MGSCYEYSSSKVNKITKGFKNYEKIKEVLAKHTDLNDIAVELIRIYPSNLDFMQAYFSRKKLNADKSRRCELIEDFSSIKDDLIEISILFKKLEDEGYFAKAKEENKFLIKRESGNLDSRHIIREYINSDNSYDLDLFLKELNIDKNILIACVTRVKNNDKILYATYKSKVEENKVKRFERPKESIKSIVNGIQTGYTSEGKEFDEYEFFRLIPFKWKDFDTEIRYMFDGLGLNDLRLKFQKLKQAYKDKTEYGKKLCTYSDNLYLFSKIVLDTEEQAEALKGYMDDINFKFLTPIYRASTVLSYDEVDNKGKGITRSEVEQIFDSMKELDLPQCREVFTRLEAEKIARKNIKIKKLIVDEENK